MLQLMLVGIKHKIIPQTISEDLELQCYHIISGYFNRPWEWEQIKQNTQWIVQFGSTDDPFVPFSEQEEVAEGTAAEFHQFSDKGHFMSRAFPELINILMSKLQQS